MATQHDIFHSMDRACSQLCVSFQVKINTTKLQMSPSLYLEYILVVLSCCCGGCTRGFPIPGRSITVIWKVHTHIHSAYVYIHNNTNCYFKLMHLHVNAYIECVAMKSCSEVSKLHS